MEPFPDPYLIHPSDNVGGDTENKDELQASLHRARTEKFSERYWEELVQLVWDHSAIFQSGFSLTATKVELLTIKLAPDAKLVRVKLRNYSASQRAFMTTHATELMQYGLVYPNPTSPWASAHLLFPKQGPTGWRFTVDLRPVKHFIKRN